MTESGDEGSLESAEVEAAISTHNTHARSWDARGALTTAGLAVPFVVFLIVYAPAAGHGFLSDDFRWILNSRVVSVADVRRVFTLSDGFYRPIVSFTFAADRALFGLNPRPYGWTNLAFAVFTAALIWRLAIAIGLDPWSAAAAGLIWLFNFHGINLSILWISGRTALVLAFFAIACSICLMRRHVGWATIFLSLAFFSKEEAFTLPIVLAVWQWCLEDSPRSKRFAGLLKWMFLSSIVAAVYLVCRAHTTAMTPSTAPSYYRFTFAPSVVLRNAFEYADRAATTSLIVCVLGFLALWPTAWHFDERSRRIIAASLVWLIMGYAITVFLPVRSSLYCIVPSVGACLIAATFLRRMWLFSDAAHRRRAAFAAVLLPILSIPVYTSRMASVPLAELSQHVLT